MPAAGNATGRRDYQFLISNLEIGKYYARLHLIADKCRDEYAVTSFELELPPSVQRFMVYPNPVVNDLTVVLPPGEQGYITITNSFGQVVKVIRNAQPPVVVINCSRLPSGLYFLTFIGNKRYTASFMKVR